MANPSIPFHGGGGESGHILSTQRLNMLCSDPKDQRGKMNLATVIAVLALAIVVFLAVRYIYKEKKKGNKCIGCPYAEGCQQHHREGTNASVSCKGRHESS